MLKELNAPRELIERLFPCLSELVELHKSFLSKLRERQNEGPVIENIADILDDQVIITFKLFIVLCNKQCYS